MKYFVFLLGMLAAHVHAQDVNTWIKRSNLTGQKREQAAAFSVGGKGYVCTGVDTLETVLNDLWQYDPIADTWTQKADLPGSARRNAIGFAIGTKGYIGLGIDNDEAQSGTKLADLWEYDPATNSWLQKANFPGAGGNGLYYATSFVIDNKGYVCGGKVGPSAYVNELWEYKPSMNQWTLRAPFAGGIRYNMSSLSIGNYAYVGLGTDQDVYRNDWWRYSPATNTWSAAPDFIGGQRAGASAFTLGNKGYICLGTNGGLKDDLWEFNPETETWSPRAYYGGSERKQAVAFTIGNRAFVGTGSGVSGKKETFYEYVPNDALSNDENLLLTISCYPNPSTDNIYIQSSDDQAVAVYLFDQQGQRIRQAEKTGEIWWMDGTGITSGAYYLLAESASGAYSKPLTVQFIRP